MIPPDTLDRVGVGLKKPAERPGKCAAGGRLAHPPRMGRSTGWVSQEARLCCPAPEASVNRPS